MTKEENPTQLPVLIFRIASPAETGPEKYEYAEAHIPIRWEDFKGVDDLRKAAKAGVAISNVVREELKSNYAKTKVLREEKAAVDKEEKEAKKAEDEKNKVPDYIKANPEKVLAKRNDIGPDVINDTAAAMILIKEEEMAANPHQKPGFTSSKTKTKSADTSSVDMSAAPAMGGQTKKVRFYKGEYGWSFYPDVDSVQKAFEWLVAVPKELRHRRDSKYPMVSKNEKYIMVNDYEKDILTKAAESQGCTVEVKED